MTNYILNFEELPPVADYPDTLPPDFAIRSSPNFNWNKIAFAGFARSGKDSAAQTFLDIGYIRANFGDIIKADLDVVILKRFGFSAFTENTEQKKMIRSTLEWYGMDAYELTSKEYFEKIRDGARLHVLPADYIRTLESKAGLSRPNCPEET